MKRYVFGTIPENIVRRVARAKRMRSHSRLQVSGENGWQLQEGDREDGLEYLEGRGDRIS